MRGVLTERTMDEHADAGTLAASVFIALHANMFTIMSSATLGIGMNAMSGNRRSTCVLR